MTTRMALFALLGVWTLGTWLFPLGGMIHILLVVALIVWIVDRMGAEDRSGDIDRGEDRH